MPPGWSHTGDHKMSSVVRKKYFEELKKEQAELKNKSTELVEV
jgi:hypothetical protein